ncbi:MAG TPA: hypothetical protein VHY57_08250 [Rhizomicrobium sp.]|jgi:hypothetical protein|nr:hypothetical protein [Rhizomicrobium sp.]
MEQSIPGNEKGQGGPPHMGSMSGGHGSAPSPASNKPEPPAVQAIGISSRDWAKLPPLVQQDLLNASQQNSLPAYRESIKNYFEKIARLHSSDAEQQSQ